MLIRLFSLALLAAAVFGAVPLTGASPASACSAHHDKYDGA